MAFTAILVFYDTIKAYSVLLIVYLHASPSFMKRMEGFHIRWEVISPTYHSNPHWLFSDKPTCEAWFYLPLNPPPPLPSQLLSDSAVLPYRASISATPYQRKSRQKNFSKTDAFSHVFRKLNWRLKLNQNYNLAGLPEPSIFDISDSYSKKSMFFFALLSCRNHFENIDFKPPELL